MNRYLGHFCDGEMSEMTLPSTHRIRNSNPGGLRSSTLPLSHGGFPQYCVLRVDGKETSRETNSEI